VNGPTRLLLDTNAVISLLDGHVGLQEAAEEAEWLGVSVISIMEYLASPRLTENDLALFRAMLARVEQVDVLSSDDRLVAETVAIRRSKQLKLPDALIVATAIARDAVLATADKQILGVQLVPCLAL
jgi:tRNA(fMet)-specific endonuclease VapC